MTINTFEIYDSKVLKVERPENYKTVYEVKEEILNKEEKEYLSAVIKPFRNKVKYIEIINYFCQPNLCHMFIKLTNESIVLPDFEIGTMYKNMELEKEYTLKELGL